MKTLFNGIKLINHMKEFLIMTFKPTSRIVQSYVLLILAGKMNFEEIPPLFNLREAVAEALVEEENKDI